MATLAQPKRTEAEPQTTAAAEEALLAAFDDLLETLTPEAREGLLSDLRANAVARGE
jgi:hypothetical protein